MIFILVCKAEINSNKVQWKARIKALKYCDGYKPSKPMVLALYITKQNDDDKTKDSH